MTPGERLEARRFLLHSGSAALLLLPAFLTIWAVPAAPLRVLAFLTFCALMGHGLGYYYCLELLECRARRRELGAESRP